LLYVTTVSLVRNTWSGIVGNSPGGGAQLGARSWPALVMPVSPTAVLSSYQGRAGRR